ncbi:hypothetical protein Tco_0742448 [Tanacetum coccineum]
MKGQDNPLIPNPHPHLLNSTIKKPIIVPSLYRPKKTHKPKKAIRTTEISQSSGPINLVADETIYKEWEDIMERAATTTSSLDAEEDSGNINRTQPMVTLNEYFLQGTNSGSGLRLHTLKWGGQYETIGIDGTLCKIVRFGEQKEREMFTLEDGEDGQLKTITEASLKIHLKLEDADGISSLPNTEIFEQLALMRFIQIILNKHQRLLLPHKRTYVASTLTQKLFSNMRRVFKGYTGVDIPLFSSMLVQGLIQVPTLPYDSPLPGGHTPGSDEGRIQHTKLMDLVIKLSDKVLALEIDLQQTKKVYSTTITKLIMKVKRLEKIVKSSKVRRRAKIIVITIVTPTKTGTQEDHLEDQLGVLSATKVLTNVARVHTYSRRRRTVSTGSGEVSTAKITSLSRASKDKGKAVITESEPEQTASKLKERQKRAGYEAAIKLKE